MAYNKFTYKTIHQKLGLNFQLESTFLRQAESVIPRSQTRELLQPDDNYPLSSEIARREILISNIFRELIYQTDKSITVYSGEIFDVDPSLGLNGEADYLITPGKAYFPIRSPVIAVAEAKINQNLLSGVGQCAAEMYAAQIYNNREGTPVRRVFGAVTTGTVWGFLVLEGKEVKMDSREYTVSDLDEILGILVYMTKKENYL